MAHNKHKKRRAQVSRHQSVLIVAIVVAVFLLVLSLVQGLQYRYDYIQLKNQRYPLKVWKLGDAIDDQKLVFVTSSIVSDDKGIEEIWQPPEGQKFIVVNMSFKNKTGVDYQLSPVSTMKLKDSDNLEYEVSSAPVIKNGLGGVVKNGETATGEVGFLAPKSAKNLKLFFDPRVANEQTIIVSLN